MLFPVHRMWDFPSLYHGEEGNQSWKQKEEEAADSNGATKSAKQSQPLGFAPGTFCACALTLQFIGMTTRYIGSAQSQMCTLKILIHLEEDGSI